MIKYISAKSAFCVLTGVMTSFNAFSLPEAPSGMTWEKVDILSDEFDGEELDSTKWYDYHPHWSGRPPSEFKKGNAYVEDGNLCLKSGMKKDPSTVDDPFDDIWVDAAACVSQEKSAKVGYYYEASMKASNLSMTSSFWFRVGDYSEIDVIEHIGNPSQNDRDDDLPYEYHANSHVYGTKSGDSVGEGWTMPTRGRDEYHLYGFWWKSATELWFYHNGVKVMEITPSVPFEENLKMVFDTEVFPFATAGVANIGLPLVENLTDDTKNTMYVDYVRTYELAEAPEGTVENTVAINDLPSSLEASQSIPVKVAYTADEQLQVTAVLNSPAGDWLGSGTAIVEAGSGDADVTISLEEMPAVAAGYNVICDLRPVGGAWDTKLVTAEQQIELTAESSDIVVVNDAELAASHDGYIQDTTGYNTTVLKVENNRRTSYLQYDLSSIDGDITSMTLKLTVGNDPGNGTINIYSGSHSNWSQTNLSPSTAPETGALLSQSTGALLSQSTGALSTGDVVAYDVTNVAINDNLLSLVVEMAAGGNDVSFNSNEAASGKPVLEIVYTTTSKSDEDPVDSGAPVENVIAINELPASLEVSQSIPVKIGYTAAEELQLTAVLNSPSGEWLGNGSVVVEAGSGEADVTIALAEMPEAAAGYEVVCDLRPVGGAWEEKLLVANQQIELTSNLVIVAKDTALTTSHDGYIQDTTGYNTTVLKVENNRRTSYLQYDLSSVDGDITSMTLKLTVGNDPGNGTVNVYSGSHSNWSQTSLSPSTAPEAGALLSQSTGALSTGDVVAYDVTKVVVNDNLLSLVIEMDAGGNDVSFNSNEAASGKPVLEVSYNTTVDESAATLYTVVFNSGEHGEFSNNSVEYTVDDVEAGVSVDTIAPTDLLLVDSGYLFDKWNVDTVTADYQVIEAEYVVNPDESGYDWADVAVPADPGADKKWELQESFSDDFNYTGKSDLFTSKWNDSYFKGWTGPGLTYWDSNESEVMDGSLLIMASRKTGTDQVNCGVVTSKEKVIYPIYMEARIKASKLELSSNFWMLSEDDEREIDMVEVYGGASNSWFAERMSTNFHVFIRDENTNAIIDDYSDQTHNTLPNEEYWSNDYHTYGVYWKSPTEVFFYIDGAQTPEGSWAQVFMNSNGVEMDKDKYTMDREMFMIIDTEDHAWRSDQGIVATDADLADDSKNIMYVDWVRTYKPVDK